MVTVIEAGCAECHGAWEHDPLVTVQTFGSVEEAKVYYEAQGWLRRGVAGETVPPDWWPHPQGGEHAGSGQGSVWILPAPDGRAAVQASHRQRSLVGRVTLTTARAMLDAGEAGRWAR